MSLATCEQLPRRIPGVVAGGFVGMVNAEAWCVSPVRQRLTFRGGRTMLLCGKHAGIYKRMRHGPTVVKAEHLMFSRSCEVSKRKNTATGGKE